MDPIKVQEYMMLRTEIQDMLKTQINLTTFSITTVVALLGIAFNLEEPAPEMFLLPFLVLLLLSLKVYNYKRNITNKIGYMIAHLECSDGIMWESCLNRFRENEKGNRNCARRIIVWLETQEYTIMGIVCMIFFIKTVLDMGECKSLYFIEGILGIVLLVFIVFLSRDYWNMNTKDVDELCREWKRGIDGERMKMMLREIEGRKGGEGV